MADRHNIPKGKMHSNCSLLPDHIVCKLTQRNNIRRANTCDPALKLLKEEITSKIQKHKPKLWKEHLDAHWDYRHHTHILWKTIHVLSNRAPPPTQIHIQQQNSNHTKTYCELFYQTLSNTQHTRQMDTQTEQCTKYKDIASHSPQLRSKRQ